MEPGGVGGDPPPHQLHPQVQAEVSPHLTNNLVTDVTLDTEDVELNTNEKNKLAKSGSSRTCEGHVTFDPTEGANHTVKESRNLSNLSLNLI